MKLRRRKSTNGGAPKWMVTYSDMVTLILVFFILLFSMSQISQEKFDAVSDSFQNRMIFDFFPSAVPLDNPTDNSEHEKEDELSNEFEDPLNLGSNEKDEEEATGDIVEETEETEIDSLTQLINDVESFLDENKLNDVISATRTTRGVELVLQDSILFEPGEAEILDEGIPFLERIGTLLSRIENDIKVEGHTDTNPMNSYRYPSNWELSGARASVVVRFLVNELDINQSRFSIAGYGETMPIAPNDSKANMTKNRRVEIIILDEPST
ncbi:flagellar motor protein MotS [Oceanobacillus bengalensis]|uniref:Flagellar motor protein MotB n=1 Tax=Oceanobacillus bengalensis TaxID=1435466 RepID=A0A494YXI5_9BACI|nr:flagellar motor protein MotS [Oceanobacillus bengalensis]RKQ14885.1 flagellar motor protein MotB [Oceanobacillus bengalensis]